VTVELLTAEETEAFDVACRDAGARFSGGVMACAAMAERGFTGKAVFRGFTPSDTRTVGVDTLSAGWFASLFPVTVTMGDGTFGDAARASVHPYLAALGTAFTSAASTTESRPQTPALSGELSVRA
jgi:hypothetical protein